MRLAGLGAAHTVGPAHSQFTTAGPKRHRRCSNLSLSTLSRRNHLPLPPQARNTLLVKRKNTNREAEAVSNVAQDSVPKGNTPWERVISVVNFNAEGISKDPFKELSRFKGCLLEAKKANVPVAA